MRPLILLTLFACNLFAVHAADSSDSNEIQKLIQQLGGDDFQQREEATARLWNIGTAAEPPLRTAAQNGDPETKSRAGKILEQFDAGIFADTPAAAVPLLKRLAEGKESIVDRQHTLESISYIREPVIERAFVRILRHETNATLRDIILTRIANRPTCIRLIAAGENEKAAARMETLAPEDADTARDYAVYLMLTGGLRERIAAIKEPPASPKTARYMAYLHLVNDDLRAAADAAAKSEDIPLRRLILLQLHDWKALRELPAPSYGAHDYNLYGKRAEDYVRLLLIRHFTGEDFTIKPPDIPDRVWPFNDSLTLAAQMDGRIDDTAKMFLACDKHHQTIQLYLSNGLVSETMAELNRAEHDGDKYALSNVVETLQMLGELKKASEIEQRIDKKDWPEREIDCHLTFLRGMHAPDELRRMTAQYALHTNERHLASMLGQYFTNSDNYIKGVVATRWWVYLRKQNPETDPEAVLRQMKDKVMQGIPPPEPCNLDLEFGTQRDDRTAVGLWAFKEREWDAAAKNFRAVWEESKDQNYIFHQHPDAFCFWAWAQAKTDKSDERLKLSAALLAAADQRNDLAWKLQEIGLDKEARDQLTVTSRLDSSCWQRLASECATHQQWQQAADWLQAYAILRPDMVRISDLHKIHIWRVRGFLLEHNVRDALAEVEKALKLLPGDVSSAIEISRDLEREKQSDGAERVFRSAFNLHTKICTQWPSAACHHYDIARLCLAAGKELDAGFVHAKRAAELFPYQAEYLRTLVEFFIRNRENDKASELKKRALLLETGN